MFAPAEELYRLSPCASCQQGITGIGIQCTVCPNKLRICTECFELGAEIILSSGTTHKPDHSYTLFESSGSLRVFPTSSQSTSASSTSTNTSWTAKEYTRLLDSIEQYGFGNWYDISKFIETKQPQEAKEEYVRRFVMGNLGKTWLDATKCDKIQRPVDKTVPDFGPLSPSSTRKLLELEVGTEEATQLGYMPRRDDYEKEFDNDAEKLVSQLVFNPEDEETEVALKLALVDMYCRRLRERVRRKRVIRDYQLVNQFFKKDRQTTGKRFQAYEKELLEKYKPFAQFHTSLEHHHFIQNLVKEKELRFRLQELFKYRKNGVTTISDTYEYERYRSKKTSKIGGLTTLSEEKIGEASESGDNTSIEDTPLITDAAAAAKRRRRKRAQLFSRQKSHSPAVLMRRYQLKLRGIAIRSAYIATGKGRRKGGLVPAKGRRTKGLGRPIYC